MRLPASASKRADPRVLVFNETALRQVTETIMQESHALLEIVNFNIEGQQYVCAGHVRCSLSTVFERAPRTTSKLTNHLVGAFQLRPLAALTSLLNQLSALPSTSASDLCASRSDLHALIASHIAVANSFSMPVQLERGVATIPLKGIDVPFHSSHLRSSVPSYRKFLQQHISKDDLQVDRLENKFIPNLVGKPFRLDQDFLKETWQLTGSEILRELIETGGA